MYDRIEAAALSVAYLGFGIGCLLVAKEAFGLAWSAGEEMLKELPAPPQQRAAS